MALNYNLSKVYALSDNDQICSRNSNIVCNWFRMIWHKIKENQEERP
jgi:hypothetical protein